MTDARKAENSILNEHRETIWEPFVTAVKRYELINSGDRVAVCISGGKDSMLMAKLVELYQRDVMSDFGIEYIVMDPGYNSENRRKIEENAKLLEVPVNIFESDIFEIANNTDRSPCYLCARMRRGHLYAKAKELGCNKIALGHHLSDVIETLLLSMFYASQIQGMMPKLHSTNFEGMELIRPLYCINEEDIISWCASNKLEFIRCACRFTENTETFDDGTSSSKRQEVKQLIKTLREEIPDIEHSIFESLHNLNLDSMIEYKTGEKYYNKYENRDC